MGHRAYRAYRAPREYRHDGWTNWFPVWWRTLEIAIAAPQVVACRVGRIALGGNGRRADHEEIVRMTREKADAWVESSGAVATAWVRACMEISAAMLRPWWRVASAVPWSLAPWNAFYAEAARHWARRAPRIAATAIAPVHRRATANARRLGTPRRAGAARAASR